MKLKILILSCVISVGLFSGCKSQKDKVSDVLASCGYGGLCHGSKQQHNTVFEGVDPTTLVNKSSKRFPHYRLIVLGNLKKSFLYQKLLALPTMKNRPGTRMPRGKKLSEKKIAIIRKWIEAKITKK